MLRDLEQQPDAEWPVKSRMLASALSVDLKRELARRELRSHPPWPMKAVYDTVYLPQILALAESLEGRGIADVALLRGSLWEELATTQIHIVLELLQGLIVLLLEIETLMSDSTRRTATDQEIQKWIVRQHGFTPQSHWIAHCKELCGLVNGAPERREWEQCPPDKQPAIKQALRHFGMLPEK
jgi:hypothetical protein